MRKKFHRSGALIRENNPFVTTKDFGSNKIALVAKVYPQRFGIRVESVGPKAILTEIPRLFRTRFALAGEDYQRKTLLIISLNAGGQEINVD